MSPQEGTIERCICTRTRISVQPSACTSSAPPSTDSPLTRQGQRGGKATSLPLAHCPLGTNRACASIAAFSLFALAPIQTCFFSGYVVFCIKHRLFAVISLYTVPLCSLSTSCGKRNRQQLVNRKQEDVFDDETGFPWSLLTASLSWMICFI